MSTGGRILLGEGYEHQASRASCSQGQCCYIYDVIWKDRVLLTAHPAQHQDTARGKRCWPYRPVFHIIYTIISSIPLPNGKVTGDVSDTRDSPTGTI